MDDLITFRNEVTVIVTNMAKAVLTEIFIALDKVSLFKQSPDTERLCALLDALCEKTVEKILKVVESESGKGVIQTPMVGEEQLGSGASSEHTYILVCGSAAPDSSCLLVSVPNHASGKSESSSTDAADEAAPQPGVSDHEYARVSSPWPGTVPDGASGASAARSHKQRSSKKRRKEAEAETEAHHECPRCQMLFPTSERLSDHQHKCHPLCSVCGMLFSGILRLRQHESQEHGLLPYTCDYCSKRFNHKAHRDLHVKARHTGEKTCHCDICGKGYSCVSVLKTHRMTHFEKSFICDVCGKSFYHACHLTRHKLTHQQLRPYQCSTCGKGFTQAANLHSHQLIHTGHRQLCSICGRSYRCLKNHIISKHSHELLSDELPARHSIITCDACGKKFPNPSQYKVHQRSHTGEKPFHCDICGKGYRLKELLRDHRYTHTGEKPYRCSLCSKTFNLATSYMRHRSVHSGVTPYSCLDCGKHFRLLTFLKAHLQTKAHLKQMQNKQTVSSDI
ncbi:zinc finger protein 79-like isoform X2 [Betta splendens]|uniref:Zinc finger protein 79-like isoform X2 n=1 Tax=Betta splendens TaxID=158456 RepID=A0A6P7KLP5_BETSP|nr:zinc finger protein 79-like isoform X2 [Betta splendens]